MQNRNAAVERSLSDNKNTLTAERVKLSDEALMGLRRMKEEARSVDGAHNVDTSKPVIERMRNAHALYVARKKEEEVQLKKKLDLEKAQLEEEKRRQEDLKKAEARKTELDQREKNLQEDESKASEELQVAQELMKSANASLDAAIAEGDMVKIKSAREMHVMAEKKYAQFSEHKKAQDKARQSIGSKRKSAFDKLLNSSKKKAKK